VELATIKDVANLAGLSVATVSRAMNGTGYVSEEAKKKITYAIKELDYSPNEVARSLFQKKSKLVGLLLPDISNPFFPMVAKGVEDFLQKKGYQVILGNIQEDNEKANEYLRAFEQNNVAGILSAVEHKSKNQSNIPTVILDRIDKDVEYGVYSDDTQGGKLAAEAILKGKPHNIVVIAGPESVTRARDRLMSVEQTLRKANVPYSLIQSNSFLLEDAKQTATLLFDHYPNVDSIIAPSDTHAITILQEAYHRGYQVPKSLQVIGYDDVPISKLVVPRLTTIHQPAYQVGFKGAEMLYSLMNNEYIERKKIILPVHLEVRETVRDGRS
jgi:LacI family transcriptional regulator